MEAYDIVFKAAPEGPYVLFWRLVTNNEMLYENLCNSYIRFVFCVAL